jgi:hypothetical protein
MAGKAIPSFARSAGMIPEDGNYYPWQLELWAWDKAEQEKRGGGLLIRSAADIPHAKLSDLLRCVEAARARPEIWDRYIDMAAKDKCGELTEEDSGYDLGSFVGSFTGWFCMKNNLDAGSFAYSGVHSLLFKIASGQVTEENTEAIKLELGAWSIIDDLPNQADSKDVKL